MQLLSYDSCRGHTGTPSPDLHDKTQEDEQDKLVDNVSADASKRMDNNQPALQDDRHQDHFDNNNGNYVNNLDVHLDQFDKKEPCGERFSLLSNIADSTFEAPGVDLLHKDGQELQGNDRWLSPLFLPADLVSLQNNDRVENYLHDVHFDFDRKQDMTGAEERVRELELELELELEPEHDGEKERLGLERDVNEIVASCTEMETVRENLINLEKRLCDCVRNVQVR
eukprot:763574-Hanusia_phi.AAC.11